MMMVRTLTHMAAVASLDPDVLELNAVSRQTAVYSAQTRPLNSMVHAHPVHQHEGLLTGSKCDGVDRTCTMEWSFKFHEIGVQPFAPSMPERV